MSKVVGVGLQWSKVVVTKQFGVVVKHIGEHLCLTCGRKQVFHQ